MRICIGLCAVFFLTMAGAPPASAKTCYMDSNCSKACWKRFANNRVKGEVCQAKCCRDRPG